MSNSVYGSCKEFLKKYPMTIAWRKKKHCNIIEKHLNDDEVVLYTFIGQRNTTIFQPFYTTAIVLTNKRMILSSSRFLGRYYYSSITPDMLNDFEIVASLFFGAVEIDTIKEHFIISCLDKKSLASIEDAVSKYLLDEKLKYMKNKNL